MMLVIPEKKL